MRLFFGKLFLWIAERILGQPACFIYQRLKKYPVQRSDGYKGQSPFFHEPVLREFTYFFILPNKYPYQGWKEHYLVVPRREIESLSELNDQERQEFVHILALYESEGYVVMSQQFGVSKNGSISHKHVHLLK